MENPLYLSNQSHSCRLMKTFSGWPRLPDLQRVIVMDSRLPGMLHVDDVMQAGDSRHQRELSELQGKLSFDDPINIQFTSVTASVLTGNRRRDKSGDRSDKSLLSLSPRGPRGTQREPLCPTTTLSTTPTSLVWGWDLTPEWVHQRVWIRKANQHDNMTSFHVFLFILPFSFQPRVRICVPVPLYHCFGSVLGGMMMAVHGVTLVFPSTAYNSEANLQAIQQEK